MADGPRRTSMDTILTFDNRDNQSEWSVEWSTINIPTLGNAAGSQGRRRERGRRRLRIATLALGSCLTMHCRVAKPAVTTGLLYYLFLTVAVGALANPLRHFEVYLGQWSISGPGRAFRILPMFDGIGLAMCINSLIRAINCCVMAAIALLYVVYSSSDSKLPFTYCRDWNLKSYNSTVNGSGDTKAMNKNSRREFLRASDLNHEDEKSLARNIAARRVSWRYPRLYSIKQISTRDADMCNELFYKYPLLYSPPAYNYFYVELLRLRPSYEYSSFNVPLIICLCVIWVFLWLLMLSERLTYGRLVWNNLNPWVICVPWAWTACLAVTAICSVSAPMELFKQVFAMGNNEIFLDLTDAFVVALYIHSASTGTEIIHGKGLNHFSSGHIDPLLNYDNVWHSGLVLALASLHSVFATVCTLSDAPRPVLAAIYDTREKQCGTSITSTFLLLNVSEDDVSDTLHPDAIIRTIFIIGICGIMWVMPMYSQCTTRGNHSHALSCFIFGGLSFSYVVVAYSLIKTSLHTIFEYRVKLVFVEQRVVAALVMSCLLLSLPYATTGGLALLESVESLMTGVVLPLVVLVEVAALLYVYRGTDFKSDVDIANEETTCSSRIYTSWQIIPVLTIVVIVGKIMSMCKTELPMTAMWFSLAPLLATVLALPLRAIHNAIVFLHPAPRRGI